MRHVLRALLAETEAGELVIRPERAVEEGAIGIRERIAQGRRHTAGGGEIGEAASRGCLADQKTDVVFGVARASVLEMNRRLARHRNRLDEEPGFAAVAAR